MRPSELIDAAIQRISKPEHHCRLNLGESLNGWTVSPQSSKAVRWCARGALHWAAYQAPYDPAAWGMARAKMDEVADGNMSAFNDLHTHAEVLERMAMARDQLRAEGR